MLKNKILQINKFFLPEVGGVETVVNDYCNCLNSEFNIQVLCSNRKFKLGTKLEKKTGLITIRAGGFGTYFSMPISISLLWVYLKIRNRFDVIFFHEPFPIGTVLAAFLTKDTPFIVVWHSDIIRQKWLKIFIEPLQLKSLKNAEAIITTSKSLASNSSLISRFADKTHVIPLGCPDPIEAQEMRPPEIHFENYAIFLGRLVYYKGIDILLEAMDNSDILMERKLVISGTGPLSNEVDNFIRKKGLSERIYFLNRFVSESEKNWLLRHCRFLIFPSTHESEAFGIVQLEAMAHSKPVINTNLKTGVPEVSIHQLTGISVKPGCSDTLRNAIRMLDSSDELCIKYGNNARQRFLKEFEHTIVCKKLSGLTRTILKRPSKI